MGAMNVIGTALILSLVSSTVTSEAIRNFTRNEADATLPTLTERESKSNNPNIIASVLNDGDSYREPPLTLDHSPREESSVGEDHSRTYDVLYQQGIDHYLSNDWHQCVGYFQLAVKDHKWYKETLISCRRDCKAEALSATPLAVHRDTSQEFYETIIKNALCLLKCRQKHFSARHHHVAPLNVDRDFAIRKPYDYLQLCLFKIGRIQDAANAAVTVLAAQPTHVVMSNNLKQYIEEHSADQHLLENLELQEYATEYVRGDHAHTSEDYTLAVQHMEAALALYWRALDDCRLTCDEPFDQGWFPDFVSSVANHYTFTFRCKRKCGQQLSNLYGEDIENFLPSILNYLQYGYQKLDQIPKACGAVESYLELLPADAAMLRNKQYYLSNYQKVDRYFVVRKEIAEHAARERYEERLLNFIDTEFVFLEEDRSVMAENLLLQNEELNKIGGEESSQDEMVSNGGEESSQDEMVSNGGEESLEDEMVSNGGEESSQDKMVSNEGEESSQDEMVSNIGEESLEDKMVSNGGEESSQDKMVSSGGEESSQDEMVSKPPTPQDQRPDGKDQTSFVKKRLFSEENHLSPEEGHPLSKKCRSEGEEQQLPSWKDAPAGKDAPAEKGTPSENGTPSGKGASSGNEKAPSEVGEAPAENKKDVPSGKDTTSGKEKVPSRKEAPSGEETAPSEVGEAPSPKEEAPAGKRKNQPSEMGDSLAAAEDRLQRPRNNSRPEMKPTTKKPTLAMDASQLNGTLRYVVDTLISDIKCKILTALIHVAGERGDGYHRNVNPHTEAEDFIGLTLSRAGLMVHAGLLQPELLQLVLQVTTTAKAQLVHHFQLQRPLYFSYTHLVCRTAKPEYYGSRVDGDMSHVVHVDNCIMYSPTECHQRPPAYTFRDYSAILYLNHDFQGGEFVFTTDPRGEDIQSSVKPKCGRMVGFSAGPENPHGVKPVLRGSRCALALWFTHDEKHKDKERTLAETLLDKIKLGEIKVK